MDRYKIPFGKEDQETIASAAIWGIVVAAISIGSAFADVALNLVQARGAAVFVLAYASVYLPIVLILGIWPAPLIEVMDISIENLVRHIAITKL